MSFRQKFLQSVSQSQSRGVFGIRGGPVQELGCFQLHPWVPSSISIYPSINLSMAQGYMLTFGAWGTICRRRLKTHSSASSEKIRERNGLPHAAIDLQLGAVDTKLSSRVGLHFRAEMYPSGSNYPHIIVSSSNTIIGMVFGT